MTGLGRWLPRQSGSQFGCSFSLSLSAGFYYLKLDGIGKTPVPNDEGYSDYGSIGQYTISGNIGAISNGGPGLLTVLAY